MDSSHSEEGSNNSHSATSQKTAFFIVTAVKSSNSTYFNLFIEIQTVANADVLAVLRRLAMRFVDANTEDLVEEKG
jgi:hypothetical protein